MKKEDYIRRWILASLKFIDVGLRETRVSKQDTFYNNN